ncbi:glycosyl hydrolase [Microbacterium sulfonylureivorans]|uniref:glycosyl hydrolase n=1 Tax=Microbacterium sulfonylureivorans TaxID=2486854 RepID=UPI000FDA2912|nr:glycosyl hydrolase [Microbacterium sulfonylureivorans]
MTAARTRLRALALLMCTAAVVAGCAPGASPSPAKEGWTAPGSSTDASAAVGALPVAQLAPAIVSRAAADIAPPTNRWYSGVAFGDVSERIFPFPLALDLQAGSFTVTLPRVAASAATIATEADAGVAVALPADTFTVVRATPVSVTARYALGEEVVGDLTTAEGWPVIAFTAARDVTLTIAGELRAAGSDTWTTSVDGRTYGVRAPDATVDAGAVRLPAGATAQWFAVPADSDAAAWSEALGDPVTEVEASFAVGDDTVSTRLRYLGTDATVVVPMPGRQTGPECALGTFETVYGLASACAGTALEWSVPRRDARADYDFSALDDGTRSALAKQVAADFAATGPPPADTYFGGKALARLAALLSLARSLGDAELAEVIADRLEVELEPWIDPEGCRTRDERCFVYDDVLRLVVGRTPSFGSEEGNDHHFHYGYFLTAAAALAEARPETVDALAPVMDVLAADVAAGTADATLPALRVFDPFRGHSWASGMAPFADGNNQESSSEAVAAWNGLALWARARGDADLERTAEWMLSSEVDAARTLWLDPDLAGIPPGFDHGMISLVWGGKREYATWFSAEPSAILGIQILPLGPLALDYLADDPALVAEHVAEAGGEAAFAGALGEYVLAYSALAGPEALAAAKEHAATLDGGALDDGTSLSALLAWLTAVDMGEGDSR